MDLLPRQFGRGSVAYELESSSGRLASRGIQQRALIARSRWVEAIECWRTDIDRPDLIVASSIFRDITAEVRLAPFVMVLGRRRDLDR